MSKAHTRQVFKSRSTPADQRREARINSGCAGRRFDSAARDEQGNATRSDIDGNDAKRPSSAAIETRHASSDTAARRRPCLHAEAGLPHLTWRMSNNGNVAASPQVSACATTISVTGRVSDDYEERVRVFGRGWWRRMRRLALGHCGHPCRSSRDRTIPGRNDRRPSVWYRDARGCRDRR